MNALVPILKDGAIIDGVFIKALEFCKVNCGKGTCKSFYDRITRKDCGKFLVCPHGMSVYISESEGEIIPFVSLRNKDVYDKDKSKKINNPSSIVTYNPLLDTEKLMQLINYSGQVEKDRVELSVKKASFEKITHEAKELISKVKEHSGILLSEYETDDETDVGLSSRERKAIFDKIKTIHVSGAIAHSRFTLLDYEKNPQVLKKGAMYDGNIHGKFLKMAKIFSPSTHCRKPIRIIGKTSHKCIRAYPSFELIPFLIIDNAVKYSYPDNPVEVIFTESDPDLFVEIKSFGPICTDDEMKRIFEKGFRGKNAESTNQGSGIGLFFVKILCDLHNIDISVFSEGPIVNINSMEYTKFVVRLRCKNVYKP